MKGFCFRLLCLAGVLAGGVLLWPGAGPDPGEEGEGVMAAVPALGVADPVPYRGDFLVLEDPGQPIPAGTRGVILPMKTPEGQLGYVSRLPRAMEWGASSGEPGRNEAIRAVTEREDLHTVALVACLADDLAGQDRDLALLRESGSAWVDSSGQTWLDPAGDETRTYLSEICRETAALGFDEILLTHCRYPHGACPEEGEESLEEFCRTLQTAGPAPSVMLSVVGRQGQDPALLATFPGRVWAAREDLEALAPLDPVLLPEGCED